MGKTANKITSTNFKPSDGDGRFQVYSKQFNDLVDVVNEIEPTDGNLAAKTLTTTGINTESVEVLEAYAGGGQANATQITKRFAIITDVATEGDSLILPVGVMGQTILLYNLDVIKHTFTLLQVNL